MTPKGFVDSKTFYFWFRFNSQNLVKKIVNKALIKTKTFSWGGEIFDLLCFGPTVKHVISEGVDFLGLVFKNLAPTSY